MTRHFDEARVIEAIRIAEEETSCEMVAVCLKRSDSYIEYLLLIAALGSILIPLFGFTLSEAVFPIRGVILSQLLLFALIGGGLYIFPGAARLAPGRLKEERARQAARAHFIDQGVHKTEERNGLLFFISLAERYIEILPDSGIQQKIPQELWQNLLEEFKKRARRDQLADAFSETILSAARLLASHFPGGLHNANQVQDRTVYRP